MGEQQGVSSVGAQEAAVDSSWPPLRSASLSIVVTRSDADRRWGPGLWTEISNKESLS
jgi:hypothetical protein